MKRTAHSTHQSARDKFQQFSPDFLAWWQLTSHALNYNLPYSERQQETSCITMRYHVVLKPWRIYWKFLWCKRNNWNWVRYKSFDITQSSNRFVCLLSHKNISQWGEISFDFAFLSSHPCGFFTIFFHTTMVKNLKKYIRKFRCGYYIRHTYVIHTNKNAT